MYNSDLGNQERLEKRRKKLLFLIVRLKTKFRALSPCHAGILHPFGVDFSSSKVLTFQVTQASLRLVP